MTNSLASSHVITILPFPRPEQRFTILRIAASIPRKGTETENFDRIDQAASELSATLNSPQGDGNIDLSCSAVTLPETAICESVFEISFQKDPVVCCIKYIIISATDIRISF